MTYQWQDETNTSELDFISQNGTMTLTLIRRPNDGEHPFEVYGKYTGQAFDGMGRWDFSFQQSLREEKLDDAKVKAVFILESFCQKVQMKIEIYKKDHPLYKLRSAE